MESTVVLPDSVLPDLRITVGELIVAASPPFSGFA